MRISLQPAFILHYRPYRETSVLLDLFTQDYGRISLIARGVRKPRSRLRALLQPFMPLLTSWQGKTELMTLATVEAANTPICLKGECLLSGLYLNEVLMRVLHKHDPYSHLYTIYHDTLLKLQTTTLQQHVLRLFEKKLLEELGYGLQLKHDALGKPFLTNQCYRFHTEHGFEPCSETEQAANVFLGRNLLALADEQLKDESLHDAKRLMRLALAPLLGHRSLQSRNLFLYREEIKTHE